MTQEVGYWVVVIDRRTGDTYTVRRPDGRPFSTGVGAQAVADVLARSTNLTMVVGQR